MKMASCNLCKTMTSYKLEGIACPPPSSPTKLRKTESTGGTQRWCARREGERKGDENEYLWSPNTLMGQLLLPVG